MSRVLPAVLLLFCTGCSLVGVSSDEQRSQAAVRRRRAAAGPVCARPLTVPVSDSARFRSPGRTCGGRVPLVTILRVADAAALLGVSEDTVRRWAEAGRLQTMTLPSGRLVVDGRVIAAPARQMADPVPPGPVAAPAARNRFRGIVTRVVGDGVMAQVALQAGPFRVVSLVSSEAALELGLERGVVAVASVKSTNVVVEIPENP